MDTNQIAEAVTNLIETIGADLNTQEYDNLISEVILSLQGSQKANLEVEEEILKGMLPDD